MKKIRKKDLAKRALTGARVVNLSPPRSTDAEIMALIAKVESKQNAEFAALADAVSTTSGDLQDMWMRINEMRAGSRRSNGSKIKLQRTHPGRLIRSADVTKVTDDGEIRHMKVNFNRDEQGYVSEIDIIPAAD